MTDYKTMRVPAEAWEQAREDKHDEETWGEFLQRCSNNPPEVRKFVPADAVESGKGVDLDDMTQACRKALRKELPDRGVQR